MSALDNILLEIIDKYATEDEVIESYEQEYAISPEDLLVQRESRKEAIELIRFAMENLSQEDKDIIEMYVIERMTYEQIGYLLGYHKSNILRKLAKIPHKLEKIYNKHATNPEFNLYNIENIPFDELKGLLFYRTPKIRFGQVSLGFPMDFLRKQFKRAGWCKHKSGAKAGLTEYTTTYQCKIRQYLAESFHEEEGETKCNLCYRCRRIEKNNKIS